MRRARILFTIPNFITAGSGIEMLNIACRLDQSLFEPFVCIRRSGSPIEKILQSKGITLIVSPFSVERGPIIGRIAAVIKLAIFFRSFGFTVWQSFHWSSDFTEAMIARLSGAKYVYTKKNMNWGRRSWIIKSILSNRIVARNRTMMIRFFSSDLFKRKAVLIFGGVDVDRFSIRSRGYQFRNKYGVAPSAFVICQVAQLVPIKGQHLIIEAAKRIPGIVAFIAGAIRNEAYAERLRNLAVDLGVSDRVFFLGSIGDVPSLLNDSDCAILATTLDHGHEEGCPVSVLEAMSCGLPCIVSNVAGSNDLIREMYNGLLFSPGSVEELVQKIRLVMDKPALARRMGNNARADVLERFTLSREAADFQKVYLM